ncbi:Epsin-1 [Neolecta irregularis DAH-3]|uniref:Epsin-1 n=1 Tax=Neolecta irregularis (strain DAH-3) TaxID=1198029 RepID=A0A1U7LP92_NEOID|nr:Epsin-1 [Neolecta irregularis DAH-3]|eukprot:OLL24490.1 Epsin-1 [Neolecta irregularis DAH-3]
MSKTSARAVVRSVKNFSKGYSDIQVKVRNATSNDPWGPSGTEMGEIASATFDNTSDLFEIIDQFERRLNDKGKNWRHVFKTLTVLDYCLHSGSENVVVWAKQNLFLIKTLREFLYIDEEGKDRGANVRQKAKDITALLQDDERLRAERKNRTHMRGRLGQQSADDFLAMADRPKRTTSLRRPRTAVGRDDDDLRKAMEESKRSAEEEARKRRSKEQNDDELSRAIQLSKEEEELRLREQQERNANNFFDEALSPPPQPVQQPYQQLDQVDFFGNPIHDPYAQRPQNTGFLDNVYSQPTGYYQQPLQPAFPQQQDMLSTSEFSKGNPYASVAAQTTNYQTPGTNNPYSQNLSLSPPRLESAPTGSNNPFAKLDPYTCPSQNSLQSMDARPETQITYTPYNPPPQQPPFPSYSPAPQVPVPSPNPHYAHLEALLSAGNASGQDTFGNTGDARIAAQHSLTGQFVNSAGHGLKYQQTGPAGNSTNPFYSQYTGQPRPIAPNLTGPAAFSQQKPQQQQTWGNTGGSLIDL